MSSNIRIFLGVLVWVGLLTLLIGVGIALHFPWYVSFMLGLVLGLSHRVIIVGRE